MQHSVLSLKEEEVVELHRQWTITIVADPSHHWWVKTPSREIFICLSQRRSLARLEKYQLFIERFNTSLKCTQLVCNLNS